MGITIERLTTAEGPAFEQAAKVIHDAFEPGYIAQSMSPTGEVPHFHETRYTDKTRHGVLDLDTYIARTGDEVEAVIIVQPPGTPDDTPNAETPQTRAFKAALPADVRTAMDTMNETETELQYRSFPDCSDLYWIAFLATSPKAQGKGLGKALVNAVRDRAQKEGRRVALLTQTESNVTYYERMGFVTHDEAKCDLRGTQITYWTMSWTPPKA